MAHRVERPIAEADLAENTSFLRFVARAQNITTTAHFVGSGRFQALTPSREHVFHAPHMSDQTLGRARGGADKYCVTDPGPPVGVNTGVNTYGHEKAAGHSD